MNYRKLSSTFFAVTVSVALATSFVLLKKQHRNKHGLAVDSLNSRTADGGAPVPPLPPWKSHANLLKDGGAPVPPLPPLKTNSNLVSDGGAPLPPPKHPSQAVLA